MTSGTIAMPCAAGAPNCTVSTGSDTYGVLPVPGYSASTGYDLATGLGSVNALNLVQNWSQVTFNSTSTTLTLTGTSSGPVSSTHGSDVSVSVTVTGGPGTSGTPMGDVSLIAGSVNGQRVDSHTLSGATANSSMATWSTNRLPGGTNYNVHAHYPGDGTFGGSDSAAIAVTVAPEGSTTSLSALITTSAGNFIPFTSVSYGTPVYLRADVGSLAHPNDTAPTGTITFTDTYSGTESPAIPPGVVPNTPYSLNSAGSAIAANGLCTLFLGTHSVTASYSGDNSYLPSGPTSATSFRITQATPTVIVLPSQIAAAVNSTFVLTVLVGEDIGINPLTGSFCVPAVPTGTVSLFNGGTQIGTPVTLGSGLISSTAPPGQALALINVSASLLTVGDHSLTVEYSGDANYLTSNSQAITVQVVTPDFTLSDSLGGAGNIVIGAPGQSSAPVTLTVSGTNGYNGTIVFSPASCVIAPAGSLSNCSFSPSSITGSGSTQLVINTTAPHAAGTPSGRFGLDGRKLQPIAVFVLFLVTFAIFKTQRRLSVAFGSVILLALFGLWACGGAGGTGSGGGTTNTIPGTPTGVPYAVSVNAAPSGVNSHSINLTFIVQ